MKTPLYQGHDLPRQPQKSQNAHKGLWFERFFNKYDRDWKVGDDAKKSWIETVANSCGNTEQLKAYAIAQRQLCNSLDGTSKVFKNDWNFVTGMGIDHPIENGMSWHSTLGVPYLTGAAVKGLIRSWVEEWSDLNDQEIEENSLKWFGSRSKKPEEQLDDNKAGDIIFFDAIPVAPTTLACDIMTPHMGKWYSDGENINKENYSSTLPADWHNPVPIPFLVVKETTLQFCIAARTQEAKDELNDVIHALQKSLEYLGAGAKTATGYGRFTEDQKLEKDLKKWIKEVEAEKLAPEERFRSELEDIDDKALAEMFGTKFNKTKKTYEDQDCNWEDIIKILMEEKSDIINTWSTETKKTAKNKWSAYKKLGLTQSN